MYLKGLAGFCVVALLFMGLTACGSSRQAMKDNPAVAASGEKTGQAAQTGLKSGEQKGEQKKDTTVASTRVLGGTDGAAVALKDIHFDFDKYLVRSDDLEILRQNSQWLRTNPAKRVRIEGNCDERGTIEYNLALGQKRAEAAKSSLVALGIDGKRMETVSYGKEKPLDPAQDEKAWAKNRRDHFEPLQ